MGVAPSLELDALLRSIQAAGGTGMVPAAVKMPPSHGWTTYATTTRYVPGDQMRAALADLISATDYLLPQVEPGGPNYARLLHARGEGLRVLGISVDQPAVPSASVADSPERFATVAGGTALPPLAMPVFARTPQPSNRPASADPPNHTVPIGHGGFGHGFGQR